MTRGFKLLLLAFLVALSAWAFQHRESTLKALFEAVEDPIALQKLGASEAPSGDRAGEAKNDRLVVLFRQEDEERYEEERRRADRADEPLFAESLLPVAEPVGSAPGLESLNPGLPSPEPLPRGDAAGGLAMLPGELAPDPIERPLPTPLPPEPVDSDLVITEERVIEHVVREGELLSKIAARYLGHGRHAQEIAELNGIDDPDKIQPGMKLRVRLPSDDSARRAVVPGTGDVQGTTGAEPQLKLHRVGRNESLTSIARTHYGNPLLWRRIYKANMDRISDPDRVAAGVELRIPADSGVPRVAR